MRRKFKINLGDPRIGNHVGEFAVPVITTSNQKRSRRYTNRLRNYSIEKNILESK